MIRSVLITMALLLWAGSQSAPAGPKYKRTTIESILGYWKKADGKQVELEGSVITGFEASIFRDGSVCNRDSNAHECTIWLKFGNCRTVDGSSVERSCAQVVEQLSRRSFQGKDDLRLVTLRNVIVRGKLSTVRKDITYDRSVPKSARIGFGHLGAYPAELNLEEMEFRE